ncbi:MAG: MFS transporter [Pseudomonadota bacterium]
MSSDAPYPAARTGWFLVVMLTLAYVLSFIDRYVLGLLVQPIKQEFSLSDIQMSWLLSAFTFVYGFVGIAMGWLIDRSRRIWIVIGGMVFWSLATVATGLARSFPQLFIARMGVGVGEATLSPATFSMIGDSFPPERRAKPIAFYSAALPLGAGVASLISAGIIAWSMSASAPALPFFGELAPWRFTLVVVGLPGFALAVAFLALREPTRRSVPPVAGVVGGNKFSDALMYLWRNKGLYVGFVLIVCTMTAIAYSQQFLAATFERTWGWPAQKWALINGFAILVIGPATMMVTGTISDAWSKRGRIDAPLQLLYAGFFLMVPTATLPFFMPTAATSFAMLCINTAGIGIVSAIGVTALLPITPPQIRGQIVAIYYLCISLFGSLGPLVSGYLSSKVFGEDQLGYALACVPIIFAIAPIVLMPQTRRLYVEQLKRLSGST